MLTCLDFKPGLKKLPFDKAEYVIFRFSKTYGNFVQTSDMKLRLVSLKEKGTGRGSYQTLARIWSELFLLSYISVVPLASEKNNQTFMVC